MLAIYINVATPRDNTSDPFGREERRLEVSRFSARLRMTRPERSTAVIIVEEVARKAFEMLFDLLAEVVFEAAASRVERTETSTGVYANSMVSSA